MLGSNLLKVVSFMSNKPQKTNGSQHVVPRGNAWAVTKAGALRATSVHKTQREAIKAASTIAKNKKTEVFIHGTDGRIRERNSYGNDPFPPKG